MSANEIVKLSSIIDFDKDKLNISSKDESKYKADLTLGKGMDVRTEGTGGTGLPQFSQILYKVPFLISQGNFSCLRGCL